MCNITCSCHVRGFYCFGVFETPCLTLLENRITFFCNAFFNTFIIEKIITNRTLVNYFDMDISDREMCHVKTLFKCWMSYLRRVKSAQFSYHLVIVVKFSKFMY